MPSTFNLFWKISGIMNGVLREMDFQFTDPAAFTTAVDGILPSDVVMSGAGTYQVAAFTNTPVCIIAISTVDGYLSWENSAAPADNGCIKCPANLPIILPSGITTVDNATGSGRAGTADSNINNLYFKVGGAGKLRLFVIA